MNRQELLQIFVLANEFKEGDLLVGGTRDERARQEARRDLGALPVGEITKTAFVEDEVSEALARSRDARLADELSHLTVTELKNLLLSPAGAGWARRHHDGLASEVIAAAVKVMTGTELSEVAR